MRIQVLARLKPSKYPERAKDAHSNNRIAWRWQGVILLLLVSVPLHYAKAQIYFDNLYGSNTAAAVLRGGSILKYQSGYFVWASELGNSDFQWSLYSFITDEDGGLISEMNPMFSDSISERACNMVVVNDTMFVGLSFQQLLVNPSSSFGDIVLSAHNPNGQMHWRQVIGQPERTEIPTNFIRCQDGGYAISGQTVEGISPNEDTQVYLVKTDSLGNQIWERIYGADSDEAAEDLIQTPDGGFLILGWTRSYGFGQRDFYLIKTDSLGNLLWERTYGDAGFDSGSSIIGLSDGNYLLGGYRNLNEKRQGYLYKIDSTGNIIWENEFGNDITAEEFFRVLELPNGEIVASGIYDPFISSIQQSDNGGLLVKMDNEGNELFRRVYQKNEYTDLFAHILATDDGGFLLGGQAMNLETMSQDAWLLKVDSVGCAYPNCITGVDEFEPTKVMVDVWPNPTSQVFNIELQQQDRAEYSMYDMAGKLLLQKQTTQMREALDVSTFENGLYLLTVLQGEMKTTLKVLVQH